MTTIDTQIDAQVAPLLTKRRPTGEDENRYKNMSKWSYKRWAWEFLRRNQTFIEACKRASTDDEKQQIAEQFGLRKFKDYKNSFRGGSGAAKFIAGTTNTWTNLGSDKYNKQSVKTKLKLGEVLVRIDLNAALLDRHSLSNQLQYAKEWLEKRKDEYAKQQEKGIPDTHRHHIQNFGVYIRLLDALAAGKKASECALLVNTRAAKDMDSHHLRALVKDQIAAAKEYATEKYRYLALLHGVPKSKEVRPKL